MRYEGEKIWARIQTYGTSLGFSTFMTNSCYSSDFCISSVIHLLQHSRISLLSYVFAFLTSHVFWCWILINSLWRIQHTMFSDSLLWISKFKAASFRSGFMSSGNIGLRRIMKICVFRVAYRMNALSRAKEQRHNNVKSCYALHRLSLQISKRDINLEFRAKLIVDKETSKCSGTQIILIN
jgi:hypothetical protein